MKSITTLNIDSQQLEVFDVNGRPAVRCADLERALGYAPKSLSTKLSGPWSGEFIRSKDFTVVDSTSTLGNTLYLYESGFDLVCIKTQKPLGKKLRRLWADEIAPRLRRGVPLTSTSSVPDPKVALAEIRLQREERLLRQARARAIKEAAKAAQPFISAECFASAIVDSAEEMVGRKLPQLRPPVEPMWSPTEIAKEAGVSVQKIGRVISQINIRGDERYSKQIINKAKDVDRQVITHLYNKAGRQLILEALNGQPA